MKIMKGFCVLMATVFFSTVPISADNIDRPDSQFEEENGDSGIDPFENPIDIDEGEGSEFSLFGRPFLVALEVQLSSEFMGDYELDGNALDDVLEVEPALSLAMFYQSGEKTAIFIENEVQYQFESFTDADITRKDWVFERVESWILFRDIAGSGLSLQVGRQTYEDERQWWWDEELDSIRLHYDRERFHSEITVARELGAESTEKDVFGPEEKNILRLLSQTRWGNDDELQYAIFALCQLDRSNQPEMDDLIRSTQADELDADLFWYGARVSGTLETENMGSLSYWIDAAGVYGDETVFEFEETDDDYFQVTDIINQDVSGWGFDIAMNWETGKFNDMVLALGYAWGAGDRNTEDNKNSSFRQTGFNEGDQRFQYYGELLNPDLSNLQIVTASIGFPLGQEGFIDFIYHHYRQDTPADFLWESDLEAEPEGIHTFIGEEWDIAYTFEGRKGMEIESSAAVFTAGDAFGDLSGTSAYRIKFEINFLF